MSDELVPRVGDSGALKRIDESADMRVMPLRLILVSIAVAAGLLGCGGSSPMTVTVTAPATTAVPPATKASAPPLVRRQDVPAAAPESGLPFLNLQVAADGCGIVRSGSTADAPQGLQWSVSDPDGFEVLGRNAAGETRYRYFQSGSYSVVLKAFDGQKYAAVSNAVSIRC